MSAPVHDNAAWADAKPDLSVLIPFLGDDPDDLLTRLGVEANALAGGVEIVVLDDGTRDTALTERLKSRLNSLGIPARLISLTQNEGRSVGRNRLAAAARAGALLFLDSDMRPDRGDFLAVWLSLRRAQNPAVAFGGFSLLQAPTDPRFRVHRSMAARSDCVSADDRARRPEKHVFTSNLLVRRDVFEAEAFDAGFSGWGWEDVEWAMRVARRFEVLHVDNPATHMGLDTVDGLVRKYEQAAPNFARMAARHPQIVAAYPSYRLARLLKRAPLMGLVRRGLKAVAHSNRMPTAARAFSLRLYRTALYAEVL